MADTKIRVSNVKLNLNYTAGTLKQKVAKHANIQISDIKDAKIVKRSIDARKKDDVLFVATIDADVDCAEESIGISQFVTIKKPEKAYNPKTLGFHGKTNMKSRPVVVGSGPAGLFCALFLAENGLNPLLIERGQPVEKRLDDIEKFRKTGLLDVQSNVQFGEGGAGTFSDGKLHTGIKDIGLRYVLETFAEHGANSDILVDGMPHIGSDVLPEIVKSIREKIISLGGEVFFGCRMTGFEEKNGRLESIKCIDAQGEKIIPCEYCVLAIGHSARDTFEMLHEMNVKMEKKPFAIGVRIEHRRVDVDRSMYGRFAGNERLGAAPYKFVTRTKKGTGVYTFCMCPGGFVLPASSEKERLCVNGMSLNARDGENSNSALLVGVTPEMIKGDSPLAGVEFQRKVEHDAYIAGGGGYYAPVMCAGELAKDKTGLKNLADVIPSYAPGVKHVDLRTFMPEIVIDSIAEALPALSRNASFFSNANAVLTGVEARSSSPVRIIRDDNYNSSVIGLIPCGEGAGYAGGIMSAAVDGLKAAEALAGKVFENGGVNR